MFGETEMRCVWPAEALLGEGPVWIAEEDALFWVDVKAPAVHRYDATSEEKTSWPMPEEIGCIAPREQGGFVAAFRSGFALLDLGSGVITPFGGPEAEFPGNRFNDGKCDARGRFWASSMDDGEADATGVLYRLDPSGSWQAMDDGYIVANGPAFSPDGATLYHTDTLQRTIYAFNLAADGALSGKRPFIRIGDGEGYPDGMTVDAQGFVWVAHWGGWRVTRFDPEGKVERVISLPVAQVTSCAFGGGDLTTLFVTTAAIHLDRAAREAQPLAGGLFEIPTDIRGLAPIRFAG